MNCECPVRSRSANPCEPRCTEHLTVWSSQTLVMPKGNIRNFSLNNRSEFKRLFRQRKLINCLCGYSFKSRFALFVCSGFICLFSTSCSPSESRRDQDNSGSQMLSSDMLDMVLEMKSMKPEVGLHDFSVAKISPSTHISYWLGNLRWVFLIVSKRQ